MLHAKAYRDFMEIQAEIGALFASDIAS